MVIWYEEFKKIMKDLFDEDFSVEAIKEKLKGFQENEVAKYKDINIFVAEEDYTKKYCNSPEYFYKPYFSRYLDAQKREQSAPKLYKRKPAFKDYLIEYFIDEENHLRKSIHDFKSCKYESHYEYYEKTWNRFVYEYEWSYRRKRLISVDILYVKDKLHTMFELGINEDGNISSFTGEYYYYENGKLKKLFRFRLYLLGIPGPPIAEMELGCFVGEQYDFVYNGDTCIKYFTHPTKFVRDISPKTAEHIKNLNDGGSLFDIIYW